MTIKNYHHGNLRNSLIEAGIEIINQEGESKLSLRKTAAMCDVSQAAPYTHFKNKEALLEAMSDYVIGSLMNELQKSIQDITDQNDPKLLIHMGKRYVMFFIDNPQYFTFIFSKTAIKIDLDLDKEATNNFPPFQLFKQNAIRILGKMGMNQEKIEDSMITMWATVHGLASIVTMKNVSYARDWGEKIEDIIWNK